MSICPGAKKVTVNYTAKNGAKSKVVINQGDLIIECEETTRTGKFIFKVNDGGYNSDCTPQHEITYYTNEFIADYYTSGTGTPTNDLVQNCSFIKYMFWIDNDKITEQNFPTANTITPRKNPNYSPGGRTLRIKNAQGALLFQTQVKDCNYTVECDDKCPEGYCKCPTSGYPGYCCLPCAQTASKIRNLAAKVGKCCG